MIDANRRDLLATLLAAALSGASPSGARAASRDAFVDAVAAIEAKGGGRLGVAVVDTAGGPVVAHRGDERFPMCSTFKLVAAALVLARVDRGDERLDRRVPYGRDAVIDYSPVTAEHVGDGMTVAQLCEAAVTVSDNTAANLLLDGFGGPAALTAFVRSLGDATTRLDRREPALNEARPGDPRDTTSPVAMLGLMRTLFLTDALSTRSRESLTRWALDCRTGLRRLRAGLPADWRVGDKTGTGARHATNDIAIAWPPGRAPVIVTAYWIGSNADDATRDAVLPAVGRLVAGR